VFDAPLPTPTITPAPNLTADAALMVLQEQLGYVEATRTAETQATEAVYAQLPASARFTINDIVTVAAPADALTSPGPTISQDNTAAGVFQPGIGLVVLSGKEVDGANWWQLGGIAPDRGPISGWVPENTPDGLPLIQVAPKLPDTDIPNQATGAYLRAPLDGAFPITQLFGDNAFFYSRTQSGGVALKGNPRLDFGVPTGTPLFAVDAGVVSAAGSDPGGNGNFVRIDHSWGQSVYTNMDMIMVTQSQSVEQGQSIGTSGNSGTSAGPHLSFGMRINPFTTDNGWAGYSDPLPYLPPGSYILPTYVTQAGN
jgi:murein DD-endopeptidase MepM/ murein hydrolase activator NlpD